MCLSTPKNILLGLLLMLIRPYLIMPFFSNELDKHAANLSLIIDAGPNWSGSSREPILS